MLRSHGRHSCRTHTYCLVVRAATQQLQFTTWSVSSGYVFHEWRNWSFPNPAEIAHSQLCQSCQQHLAAYLHDIAATWLFEFATRFTLPDKVRFPRELTPEWVTRREGQLDLANYQALAHRAVLARWQPTDDDTIVPMPRPKRRPRWADLLRR